MKQFCTKIEDVLKRENVLFLPSNMFLPSNSSFISFSGWGRISSSSNHVADKLKQSLVPVVDQRTCARKNGANVHEDSMVCVGGAGSSACHGDSGGPLMCEEGSGHWVLRGAASWVSHKTCPKDGYTVYARVSSYIDWINSQIASMS